MKLEDFHFNEGDMVYAESKNKAEWIIGVVQSYGICSKTGQSAKPGDDIHHVILVCGGWAAINDVMFDVSINPDDYTFKLLKETAK